MDMFERQVEDQKGQSYHKRYHHLEELGFTPISHKDGYNPVKNRRIHVAILDRKSLLNSKTGE